MEHHRLLMKEADLKVLFGRLQDFFYFFLDSPLTERPLSYHIFSTVLLSTHLLQFLL